MVRVMAKYIELEAILDLLKNKYQDMSAMPASYYKGYQYALKTIEKIKPAADVAPVVHGHFVHDGPRFAGGVDWWHCSSCGRLVSGVETRFDYCPNCGLKMDLEE